MVPHAHETETNHMHRRTKIIAATLGCAVAVAVAVHFTKQEEPIVDGKRLSSWLLLIDAGPISAPDNRAYAEQDKAHEIVQALGTNTVPTLLHMLQARDSRARVLLARMLPIRATPARALHQGAYRGFQILGTNGQAAAPLLLAHMSSGDAAMSNRAANALDLVGYQWRRP
jgi:hypothetical protein